MKHDALKSIRCFMRKYFARQVFLMFHPKVMNITKQFSKTAFFNESEIVKYQNEKLVKLIHHSYDSVLYYKELFDKHKIKPTDIKDEKDLEKLPILTKDIIRKEGERMFSNKINRFNESTTSGSTGVPITIRKSVEAKNIELALMRRFMNDIGHHLGDKEVLIWGDHSLTRFEKIISSIKNYIYNVELFNSYEMYEDTIEKLVNRVIKNPPKLIRGYATAVSMFADKMLSKGYHMNFPAVTVTAEQLHKEGRIIMEEAFGSNIYDQYGCGEVGALAFECKEHIGFHHAFEHSIIEVLAEDGSKVITGKAIITDLDNFTMPLIRYENGDIITLSDLQCSCGRYSTIISRIDGRTFDCIKGTNGNIVHGGFFDEPILDSGITRKYDIRQIRIIQKQENLIIIEYVGPNQIEEESKEYIIEKYQRKLGNDMQITFSMVDKIPLTKSGKRKYVVSFDEYKKGNY